MKILVTGAGGMVGRNVIEHKHASLHEILAPRRAELDLSDRQATLAYLRKHKPEMIIHCAGRAGGIQANIAHPIEFMVENVDIGRNIIGSAFEVGIPKLLNVGSACVFPRHAPNPLREEMVLTGELEPTNEGYALAKIMALRLCEYVRREKPELQYKTLIGCNLYGRFDKFNPAHSHLIPAIIHRIHQAKEQGLSSIEIWGDGTARREFMSASDFADLILSMVERFSDAPDVMNGGVGYDQTINEYYEVVAKVIGYNGAFKHDLTKPVGMKQKLVSIDRLKAFGWKPKMTLEEGIRITYEFYLKEGYAK